MFLVQSTRNACGVYKLDIPVTIAQLQGKPVILVVGKPKRPSQAAERGNIY